MLFTNWIQVCTVLNMHFPCYDIYLWAVPFSFRKGKWEVWEDCQSVTSTHWQEEINCLSGLCPRHSSRCNCPPATRHYIVLIPWPKNASKWQGQGYGELENGRSSSHGLHICIWNGCEYSRFAHHTLSTHVILACCHLLIIFSLDVDLVIRVGCPPSVEQMVQELGRAGRDGRPCKGMTTTLHYTCFRVHVCDTCEFSRFIKD